jgi:putative DNA primase/helicase
MVDMFGHTRLSDITDGRWPGILAGLGVDAKFLSGKHGPCPLCGGKDRFRFDDKGKGLYFCSGCGCGSGMKLLMGVNNWDFATAANEVRSISGQNIAFVKHTELSDAEKIGACRRMVEGATTINTTTTAYAYITKRCGDVAHICSDLMAHKAIRNSDIGQYLPAMLGIMRNADGDMVSVHRTYLSPEGAKANVDRVRMMMPGIGLNGACIRLSDVHECIGIAEGIETAISAGKLFNLPVWAATNAGLLASWVPPAGVSAIVVFGDNDSNFTGQKAAYALANRLALDGYGVSVEIPHKEGDDWNSVWGSGGL